MFKNYLILFLLLISIKINTSMQPEQPQNLQEKYDQLAIKLGQSGSERTAGQQQAFVYSERVRPVYHLNISSIVEPIQGFQMLPISTASFIDFEFLKKDVEPASGIIKDTIGLDANLYNFLQTFNNNLAQGGSRGKIITIIYDINNETLYPLFFYSGVCFATLYGGIKNLVNVDKNTNENNLQQISKFITYYKK